MKLLGLLVPQACMGDWRFWTKAYGMEFATFSLMIQTQQSLADLLDIGKYINLLYLVVTSCWQAATVVYLFCYSTGTYIGYQYRPYETFAWLNNVQCAGDEDKLLECINTGTSQCPYHARISCGKCKQFDHLQSSFVQIVTTFPISLLVPG